MLPLSLKKKLGNFGLRKALVGAEAGVQVEGSGKLDLKKRLKKSGEVRSVPNKIA